MRSRLDHDYVNVLRFIAAIGRTAPGPITFLANVPAARGLDLLVAALILGLAALYLGAGLDMTASEPLLATWKTRMIY